MILLELFRRIYMIYDSWQPLRRFSNSDLGEYPAHTGIFVDNLRGPNHFGPGGDFDLSRTETQGPSPSGAGRTHDVQKYVPGTREGGSDVQKYVPGNGEGGSDVQKYVPKSDKGAHFEAQSGSYSGDVRMEEQSHNTELENFMEASYKNNTELENYMEASNKNDPKVEKYGEGNIH